jgi:phospholipid/cholesterol/gamma-HCH transport system substrate-binding protein
MNTLHFKVGLFAAASLLLAGVFLVYLLHARGFFEDTFHLQLASASADGVQACRSSFPASRSAASPHSG